MTWQQDLSQKIPLLRERQRLDCDGKVPNCPLLLQDPFPSAEAPNLWPLVAQETILLVFFSSTGKGLC